MNELWRTEACHSDLVVQYWIRGLEAGSHAIVQLSELVSSAGDDAIPDKEMLLPFSQWCLCEARLACRRDLPSSIVVCPERSPLFSLRKPSRPSACQ